jgi:hypothetical protein
MHFIRSDCQEKPDNILSPAPAAWWCLRADTDHSCGDEDYRSASQPCAAA